MRKIQPSVFDSPARSLAPLAVLAAMLLSGCGGGDPEVPPEPQPQLRAGSVLVLDTAVDGAVVAERRYGYLEVVDDDGTLAETPSGKPNRPVVQVLLSAGAAPAASVRVKAADPIDSKPMASAELQACYKSFWAAVRERMPGGSALEIAGFISNLGLEIEQLCRESSAAQMTVGQYVDLFVAVRKYWPNLAEPELEVQKFFAALGIAPGEFVAGHLAPAGYTWDDFAQRLATLPRGVETFIDGYVANAATLGQAAAPLDAYLVRFMSGAVAPNLAAGNVVSKAAAGNVGPRSLSLDTISAYYEMAKWGAQLIGNVWNFVTDNQGEVRFNDPDAAGSRVLSVEDPSPLNYVDWKRARSADVTFSGRFLDAGFLWEVFRTTFHVEARYGARNANPAVTIAGTWIPAINVRVTDQMAKWGWKLTGSATIADPANAGTQSDPVPEVDVRVRLTAQGILSAANRDYLFRVNAKTGPALPSLAQ